MPAASMAMSPCSLSAAAAARTSRSGRLSRAASARRPTGCMLSMLASTWARRPISAIRSGAMRPSTFSSSCNPGSPSSFLDGHCPSGQIMPRLLVYHIRERMARRGRKNICGMRREKHKSVFMGALVLVVKIVPYFPAENQLEYASRRFLYRQCAPDDEGEFPFFIIGTHADRLQKAFYPKQLSLESIRGPFFF